MKEVFFNQESQADKLVKESKMVQDEMRSMLTDCKKMLDTNYQFLCTELIDDKI